MKANRHGPRFGPSLGFWVVALVLLTVMAFSTLPTALYPIYQHRDHFPTFMITVIFAAYAVGVMISLYAAGHLSDWLGRRRMLIASVVIEAASAAVFLFRRDETSLVLARFVCGVGVGTITATATAHLAELRSAAAPRQGWSGFSTVATAVTTGGLGVGALAGGVLAEYVPAPLSTPYAVFLLVLITAGVAAMFVPETVPPVHPRPAYRPQRVSVPPAVRGHFTVAALGVASAFSVFGVLTSVTASFVSTTLHISSHLAAGAIVFGMMTSSAISQIAFTALTTPSRLRIGAGLMVSGLLGVGAAGLTSSLPVYVVGGVLAGGGVGLIFQASISVAGALGAEHNRGEVLAVMFLAAYAGLTVPVVAVGVALTGFAASDVLVTFAAIEITAVAVTIRLMVSRPRTDT